MSNTNSNAFIKCIKFLSILVVVAFLGYFGAKHYLKNKALNEMSIRFKEFAKENVVDIEYGSDFNPEDILEGEYDNIRIRPKEIDTKSSNDVNVRITVSKEVPLNGKVNKVYTKTIRIVDNQAPIIKVESRDAVLGVDYYYLDVTVNDNKDGPIDNYIIDGIVNTNQLGLYSLIISAVDSSGNKAEKEVIIEVKKIEPMIATASGCPLVEYEENNHSGLFQCADIYSSEEFTDFEEMRVAIGKYLSNYNDICQINMAVYKITRIDKVTYQFHEFKCFA